MPVEIYSPYWTNYNQTRGHDYRTVELSALALIKPL
jgi:hypothetical protein